VLKKPSFFLSSRATRDGAQRGSASRGTPALLRALQIAAVFIAATFLLGADPSGGARFENLGHKLMCRCGCNQILLECNHIGCPYSEKMRQELMAALQGPDSDDLILQRFVQEYGAVVLAAPTATGFNRVAWIAPFAALGAGIFAVVWVVRRWRMRQARLAAESPAAPPVDLELDSFRERARKETEL
jgi:cytochrome c-type biogenesis protein CcmH